MKVINRRKFLIFTAVASVGLGCTPSEKKEPEPSMEGEPLLDPILLSKQPYLQIIGSNEVRLRFETREARALPVTLIASDGTSVEAIPVLQEDELLYEWGFENELDVEPDTPGLHVLQEVVFTDLNPGERYEWEVAIGGGEVVRGSFRSSPGFGQAFRYGWIADTMFPNAEGVIETMSGYEPNLVLHGGDMVYQTNPYDTWVHFSKVFAPLTSQAIISMTLGNHEFEDFDEANVMYKRLYMPQGETGDFQYNAYQYGGIRFIHLDSESGREGEGDDVALMNEFLIDELQKTRDSQDLHVAIVVMHRPMYTLGKHWRHDVTERDRWHNLFVEYGVKIVYCGHAHNYERFVVDGIHYIVDGGGGAFLYSPVEAAEEVEAARPGESALQVVAVASHGFCIVDVAANGAMSVQRIRSEDHGVDDAFEVG